LLGAPNNHFLYDYRHIRHPPNHDDDEQATPHSDLGLLPVA